MFFSDINYSDIALLHQIVTEAEDILSNLPEQQRLPTYALFKAYFKLLPSTGVDADHDSRYARVLFKIGGIRGERTLWSRFEEVLDRMGIEIEFSQGSQAESYQNAVATRDEADFPRDANAEDVLQDTSNPNTRRRNSESTIWDYSTRTPAKSEKRRSSISPRGYHLHGTKTSDVFGWQDPQSHKPIASPKNSKAVGENDGKQLSGQVAETGTRSQYGDLEKRGIQDWLESNYASAGRLRQRSISTHGSLRIRDSSRPRSYRNNNINAPTKLQNAGSPLENKSSPQITSSTIPNSHPASEEDDDSSASQDLETVNIDLLETRARIILQHHVCKKIITLLGSWRNRTWELVEGRRQMQDVADAHDLKVLLLQAFHSWADLLKRRRSAAENERFFEHLESRAGRARDMFLIAKAFTHWSACATEQTSLTALARRHLTRFRVLNAWKNHTVAQELKVRRYILKKFFQTWHGRLLALDMFSADAITVHYRNTIRDALHRWLRENLRIQFQKQQARLLKVRSLIAWVTMSRALHNHHIFATWSYQRKLLGAAFRPWVERSDHVRFHADKAFQYSRTIAIHQTLQKWRRETTFMPVQKTVMEEIRTRTLQDAICVWQLRCWQKRTASAFSRGRLFKISLTSWRYAARSTRLVQVSETRLLYKTMHALCLTKRSADYRRRQQNTLCRKLLEIWKKEARAACYHRQSMEQDAQNYDYCAVQRSGLQYWRHQYRTLCDNEQAAQRHYEQRMLLQAISIWKARLPLQLSLQRDCVRAEFYFLARKTMEKWKAKVADSRAARRRNTYSQLRRQMKIRLLQNTMHQWQRQVAIRSANYERATNMQHNRVVLTALDAFDRWRARAEEVTEMEAATKTVAVARFFQTWRRQTLKVQNLSDEARRTFDEALHSKYLKKWGLRVLQYNAQEICAIEVRERAARRRCRRIIEYWAQRTKQNRPSINDAPDHDFGGTETSETLDQFDEDFDEHITQKGNIDLHINALNEEHRKPINSTDQVLRTPGYLATPSRKSERATVLARRFGVVNVATTTPMIPLSTPAEKMLRAQWQRSGAERKAQSVFGSRLSVLRTNRENILSRSAGRIDAPMILGTKSIPHD